jgi:hypothetical protein
MLDFPTAPSVGQLYPAAPVAGLPTYRWDGQKWKTGGGGSSPSAAIPSAAAPAMDSVANPGAAIQWSRADHRHPSDTTRAPVASPNFSGTVTAQAFSVTGDINMGGAISTTVNGSQLGNHIGTTATSWNAITQAETNIIFYDFGSNNWAGMGADQSGFWFVRSGGGGSNNVAAMYASTTEVNFVGQPYAPTPGVGDNSTKAATTAYVLANQPQGGPYLQLSGGTLTGTLTVSYGHVMPYRNGATGVLYLSTGGYYIYWDGTNYTLGGGLPLNTAAGRIWGSNDWSRPVSSARIGPFAGDYFQAGGTGMVEPYGGAVVTGTSNYMYSYNSQAGMMTRYRYDQIYVEGTWYTAGYA